MRKQILVSFVLACFILVLSPTTALADKACSFRGSWYGFLPTLQLDFMSTAHGLSGSRGTYTIEIPGFDPTLFGYYPDAVKISTLRGTWERINNQSIAFTVIGYAVDLYGQTQWIGKISGIDTFTEDCNSISISNTTEVFEPGDDPFQDSFVLAFPGAPHSAHRMRVDPPVTF